MIKGVSLFAGIGGFDLAMGRAGIDVTATAEVDKHCRALLHRQFPCTTHFTDVTEVTGDDIRATGFDPANGIVASGWPCQGNSVAGLRKGMADSRSGLWRENIRILRELRPKWFVGENVPGLLSVRRGADFYEVIGSLAELGYGMAWRVLDAQYTGVPQRRRRVLIVGCLGDAASPAEILFEPEGGSGGLAAITQARARVAGTLASSAGSGGLGGSRIVETVTTLQGGGRRGYRVDAEGAAGGHLVPVCVTGDITHTLRSEGADASEDGTGRGTPIVAVPRVAYALSAHHSRNDREQTQVCSPDRMAVRRLTPLECERLQGFPDQWTAGQSDSARYRQLGNAVAVPVAEWVMRRVANLHRFGCAEVISESTERNAA